MPEKAEIAIMSDQLQSKLVGNKCSQMIMLPKSRYWREKLYSSCEMPYQDFGTHRLYNINSDCTMIKSRGKKIIIEFNTPINTQFRMVSSCGMDGRWSWEHGKHTCLILIFDTFCAYYDDVTNKGLFSICLYPSLEHEHIFKEVGPDLMTEEVTHDIYKMIITSVRIRNMKIMLFMMEQKYMSGIGNWLRADILYKCRINPHRILCSLSEQDIYNLFYYSKLTIWEAYQNNGLTIQDYLSPDGKNGVHKCLCYGRNFDDNGFQIIKEKDGPEGHKGRTIHWCPQMQI